jgi:hypothetical protein
MLWKGKGFFMTPDELIRDYRDLGKQPLCVFARFLADHLYEAQRCNGRLVKEGDVIGVKEWLYELSDALVFRDFPPSTEVPVLKDSGTGTEVTRPCERCQHVHESASECGKYLGELKFCHCEMEGVPV